MLVTTISSGEANSVGAYGLVAPCVVCGREFCVANIVVCANDAAEVVGLNVISRGGTTALHIHGGKAVGAGNVMVTCCCAIGGALLVVVGVERCGGGRAVHKHRFGALAVGAVGDGERVSALHHGCHLVEGGVGEAGRTLNKVIAVLNLYNSVLLAGVVGVVANVVFAAYVAVDGITDTCCEAVERIVGKTLSAALHSRTAFEVTGGAVECVAKRVQSGAASFHY